MQVGSADRARRHLDDGVARFFDPRIRNRVVPNVISCPARTASSLSCSSTLEQADQQARGSPATVSRPSRHFDCSRRPRARDDPLASFMASVHAADRSGVSFARRSSLRRLSWPSPTIHSRSASARSRAKRSRTKNVSARSKALPTSRRPSISRPSPYRPRPTLPPELAAAYARAP